MQNIGNFVHDVVLAFMAECEKNTNDEYLSLFADLCCTYGGYDGDVTFDKLLKQNRISEALSVVVKYHSEFIKAQLCDLGINECLTLEQSIGFNQAITKLEYLLLCLTTCEHSK